MHESSLPMREFIKLNGILIGLGKTAEEGNLKEWGSNGEECGFYLTLNAKEQMFVGFWAKFWESGHHHPICFGLMSSDSRYGAAFVSAYRRVYTREAIKFHENQQDEADSSAPPWLMGWASEEDFASANPVDTIWRKVSAIKEDILDAVR
jgi:hypothetical protein